MSCILARLLVVLRYGARARDRSAASEYAAKYYVLAAPIKYNRTDTALVRVIVPLGPGSDEATATKQASDFVRSLFPRLRTALPS